MIKEICQNRKKALKSTYLVEMIDYIKLSKVSRVRDIQECSNFQERH